jgi:N-acetylmuramoyl-L-alanine amidase
MMHFSRFLAGLTGLFLLVLAAAPAGAEAPLPERSPLRCLALTLYWEARGEGREGMLAVAQVVLNRVAHRQFPNDVCGVVLQGGPTAPCQFHWVCNGRDNRPREARAWRAAQELAIAVLAERPPDVTRGALFFHHDAIERPWRLSRTRTAQIGAHVYYR